MAVNATINTEGIAVTLVFIDSTQGWLVTDSGLQSDEIPTALYVATGGTITTSGNDKIHTFTGPGTFTVCSAEVIVQVQIMKFHIIVVAEVVVEVDLIGLSSWRWWSRWI